jgi:GNAT superfamily N-acetyltransferase
MKVRPATTKEVLSLRARVLRPSLPLEASIYPEEARAVHFALYDDAGKLFSVVTAHPEDYPDFPEKGQWRIRGMATELGEEGKGHGAKVLRELLDWGREKQVPLFWCNARERAIPFYERFGFEVCSDLFDIPPIGAHKRMKLKL